MALRHWLQLALTEGIGPILTARLIAWAGSAEAACDANVSLLRGVEGIGPNKARQIRESLTHAATEVDHEIARISAANATAISIEDPLYPPMLKIIPDPPPVLFIRGTLEPRDLNAIGIVGSRRCSHYGREQAERFGALLAGAGMTILSGGARGIDSAAHRGAMAAPLGRTIAVLGCGVDIAYPPENGPLFSQIAEHGAVISEFPMQTPPLKEHFPRRNRIVSGMSRGILVVEADIASGALITARQACDDHSRPVFAVPGRIDNAMSAGPHALIRDGATLVTNLEEILDGLGPLPFEIVQEIAANAPGGNSVDLRDGSIETESDMTKEDRAIPSEQISRPGKALPYAAAEAPTLFTFTDRQQTILKALDENPTHVDTIIVRSDLPAEIVLQELTMMTLRGSVKRVDGQNYVKKKGVTG
jgi:DNA processing protein